MRPWFANLKEVCKTYGPAVALAPVLLSVQHPPGVPTLANCTSVQFRLYVGVKLDPATEEYLKLIQDLPIERAMLTTAPKVPPPVARSHPVRLIVDLSTDDVVKSVSETQK